MLPSLEKRTLLFDFNKSEQVEPYECMTKGYLETMKLFIVMKIMTQLDEEK